jgi:hypothetical protein
MRDTDRIARSSRPVIEVLARQLGRGARKGPALLDPSWTQLGPKLMAQR